MVFNRHLDCSVCKFQACDRYRKSCYSPHTSDHSMPTFDTLSLLYTLGNDNYHDEYFCRVENYQS